MQARVTRAGPNSLVGEQVRLKAREGAMEHEVKIRGLMMDPVTNMPVVVLKETQGTAILPIWVGIYEANAIALEIEKVQTPRPMTHDLLKNVLTGLNVHVQKVVVSDLKDDTFYALIWMERDGQTHVHGFAPQRRAWRSRCVSIAPSSSRKKSSRVRRWQASSPKKAPAKNFANGSKI